MLEILDVYKRQDQTDTIYKNMQAGKTFEEALRLRTFEPDEPNYTPRISAVVNGFDYQMSILKSAEGNPNSICRYFFDYTEELPGHGHIIHTYQNDKNPLPSFEGEPVRFKLVKEPFEEMCIRDRVHSLHLACGLRIPSLVKRIVLLPSFHHLNFHLRSEDLMRLFH